MSEKRCDGCHYFRETGGDFVVRMKADGNFENVVLGECRIGPPNAVPALSPVIPTPGRWPLVWADEWCGCHSRPQGRDDDDDAVVPIPTPPGEGIGCTMPDMFNSVGDDELDELLDLPGRGSD